MNNLIDGQGGEEQEVKYIKNSVNEENKHNIIKKSTDSDNLPLQIDVQSIEKKEVTKKNINGVETVVEKKEITRISNQNQGLPQEKKEITIITQSKIEPDTKNEIVISNAQNIKEEKKLENIGKSSNNMSNEEIY